MIAWDEREVFDRTGHLFLWNIQRNSGEVPLVKGDASLGLSIPELPAAIHLINFGIEDQVSLRASRLHLLETIRLGREMWRCIYAETEDNYEWIPSPAQRSAVFQTTVSVEQISTWLAPLSELEAVLEGRKLAHFGDLSRGLGQVLNQSRSLPTLARASA